MCVAPRRFVYTVRASWNLASISGEGFVMYDLGCLLDRLLDAKEAVP